MDLNSEVLAEITRRNIALNYGSSPEGHVLLVSGDWADASRALCLQWWVDTVDGLIGVHDPKDAESLFLSTRGTMQQGRTRRAGEG